MVFIAIFNTVSVISQRPVHLSMPSRSSFNQIFAHFFPSHWLLSHITMAARVDSCERGIILLQWLSPILRKSISQARDWTCDLLFSSPLGTKLILSFEKHLKRVLFMFCRVTSPKFYHALLLLMLPHDIFKNSARSRSDCQNVQCDLRSTPSVIWLY